ncbi:MAG TPA: ribokinase [Pirellulales bacterium]|nr:ribokinase [Pirellulales bacterium]
MWHLAKPLPASDAPVVVKPGHRRGGTVPQECNLSRGSAPATASFGATKRLTIDRVKYDSDEVIARMSPQIIVVGSVNTDLVIRVPHLPRPGETVLGGDFFQAAGGKGANQAVAAARLASGPVLFVGAVGDDAFGRQSLADLQRENLDLRSLKIVAGMPSGVAQIVVDNRGENAIAVASGANAALTADDIDAIPAELFTSARLLLVSLEVPINTVARALKRAKEHGLLTILNPAPSSALRNRIELLKFADVLTPNEIEAAELIGDEEGGGGPSQICHRLRQMGVRDCVITLGAAGCLVAGDPPEPFAGHKVPAVDTTAAGDAFNGALAVALAEGLSLVEAARFANRAAALAVTRSGAQPSLPSRNEIEKLPAI